MVGKGKKAARHRKPTTKSQKQPPSRPRRVVASDVARHRAEVEHSSISANPDNAEVKSPAERLASIRTSWERIAGTLALTSLASEIEDVTHDLDGLENAVREVRSRGYHFGGDWEDRVSTLKKRWPSQHLEVKRLLDNEQEVLEEAARGVESLLSRAARNDDLLDDLEMRIDAVERNAADAERRVREAFAKTKEAIDETQVEVDRADQLMDSLNTASFKLYPGEDGVDFCKTIWVSDQEEPEGLLFLTTHRLIFERREKVAKKKVLFIALEKELIQEKLWEAPIGSIEGVENRDVRAFLKRKEMFTLRFHERTRETPGDITLQLKDIDNETWVERIQQVKSGNIENERYGEDRRRPKPSKSETSTDDRPTPTVCPNCNAPLPQAFKGMRQITCEYCNTVINL